MKASQARLAWIAGSCVLASLGAAACATLAPVAVQWGADLVSAAASNYSQRYSEQVHNLLLAVYSDQAAKVMPGQAAGTATDPYSSSSQAQALPPPTYQTYPAQQPDLYASGNASAADPYAKPASYDSAGTSPIVLDVAILAQRASERAARRLEPAPIQDGDVLRDGGSDPRAGDVVKFSFRANCACYVYVIGIDATGYVAKVFPEKAARPVRANQQYLVPTGTAWYGLDQRKGVEQVFFVASRRPRADIETSLGQLAQTSRASLSRDYRPVREPAVPDAASRGLVKVQMTAKSTVSSESGQSYSFTPQAFAAAQPQSGEVVVTRWFRHE